MNVLRAYWSALGRQGDRVPTAPTITAVGRPKELGLLPSVGQAMGRYTVLGELGAGAMGTVFLASDPDLNRKVAIKLLASRGANDGRLLDEARALARLQHPNVVAIHDVGRWEGQVYIAMEHIAGRSLDAWLEIHVDWRVRLGAFQQAAHGLAAAHRAGIVHHDVKPSNIMVGDDGRVRLVDFGLARSGAPETAVGSAAGTPRYMSPEQRRGAVADARTDQFSLCVSIYEALFGRHPFEGEAPQARVPPAGPVPARTRDAVLRGLAYEPDRRHASVEALLVALEPPRAKRRGLWFGATAIAIAAGVGAAFAIGKGDHISAGRWDGILAASNLPPEQLAPLPDDPLQVTVHRLSNGLTVYISPNRDIPRIRALMRFRSGTSAAPGVAMMAMRMSRRGTETIGTVDYAKEKPFLDKLEALYAERATTTDPAALAKLDAQIDEQATLASELEVPDEHTRIMQKIGAGLNDANVYRDETRIDEDIPTNRFATWADLEADRWAHPVFRMFRPVVAETLQMDKKAQSDFSSTVDDVAYTKLFPDHPLGFVQSTQRVAIARQPLAEVEAYYRDNYVPNNADLILAGDIDPVTAIPLLDKAFAGWEPRPLKVRPPIPDRPAPAETIAMPTGGTREVSYHWRIAREVERDPAVDVMAEILVRMIEDTHQTHVLRFYQRAFTAALSPRVGQTLDDAAHVLDGYLARMRDGDFTDEMLASAKRALRVGHALEARSNSARVLRMSQSFPHGNLDPLSWRASVAHDAAHANITRADVIRGAKAVFDTPHLTIRAEPGKVPLEEFTLPKIPPGKFKLDDGPGARALLDREVVQLQPKYLVANLDFEERTTPAAHVIVKRDPKSPLFTLMVRYDFGSEELPLVCDALLARLEGAVDAMLHAGGIRPSLNCFPRTISITLTGLDEDRPLPHAFEIVQAMLADPTPAEWAKIVAETREKVDRLPRSSEWIPQVLDQLGLYGPAAPALRVLDVAPRQAATPDQIAATMAALRASERWVGYYGPRSVDEVVGALPTRSPGTPVALHALALARGKPRVIILTAPELSDTTHISVGFGLEHMLDEDREARLDLFGAYWNGDTHPLAEKMRGATTFMARVDWGQSTRDAGQIAFRIHTAPAEAVSTIAKILTGVLDSPIDDAHLAEAKQSRDERLRSDWIARADVASRSIQFRLRGIPEDGRPAFFARFAKLGKADLGVVIDELRRAPRAITIWGRVDALDRAALAKYGEITELTVPQLIAAPAALREQQAQQVQPKTGPPKPKKPAPVRQRAKRRGR